MFISVFFFDTWFYSLIFGEGKYFPGMIHTFRTSLHTLGFSVARLVENLPAMQETPVPVLGWEDPLDKG